MKFVLGVAIGAAVSWFYTSAGVRGQFGPHFSGASGYLQHWTKVAASLTRSGAQRASELIDAAPLPDSIKEGASDAAFNAWAAADVLTGDEAQAESAEPSH
jgi:hypothetical protein